MKRQGSIIPNVDGFILWLEGALTQYDQAQSKKKGHSQYALGHYLKAVEDIRSAMKSKLQSQDPEDLKKLKTVMEKHLKLPPTAKAGKAIDTFIATGKPPVYPGVKPTRRKNADAQVVGNLVQRWLSR